MPHPQQTLKTQGQALLSYSRYEEAIEEFEDCITRGHKLSEAYYNKALALKSFNQLEEAIKYYEKAVHLDSNKELYIHELADGLVILLRWKKAMQVLDKCIEMKREKSNLFLGVEKFEEALLESNYCIELDPKDANAFNNEGLALQKMNQFEEAICEFSDHTNAYLNKRYALHMLTKYDEAIEEYQQCIKLDPKSSYEEIKSRKFDNNGNALINIIRQNGHSPDTVALAALEIVDRKQQYQDNKGLKQQDNKMM